MHDKIPVNSVTIPLTDALIKAFLVIPPDARGLVIFVHGSGSGRLSTRNQFVAKQLQQTGFATLLTDLLTVEEDQDYQRRFDIELLTTRVLGLTEWAAKQPQFFHLPIGYFGASTGAAAACNAAAQLGSQIRSIVSRGGRPDLADALNQVTAPTLLIVGGNDEPVVALHRQLLPQFRCQTELQIVPGASHLFEEAGTLEQVADLATRWFLNTLPKQPQASLATKL